MKALPVLNSGLVWPVGNGESIDIWCDKWLPGPGINFIPYAPPGPSFSWVSDLIDSESRSWNLGLVRSLFHTNEANTILSMPISYRLPKDSLFWKFSKNGDYEVKSGYFVAR